MLATIAIHERTRQRFRRVWWFDSPDLFEQTLALALNLPHIIGEPDPVKRREWLAGQVDDHTLVIIDNAAPDDPVVDHLMRLTPNVMKVMGVTGANVVNRLSGVVLAALAVQFMIDGLSGAFGGI